MTNKLIPTRARAALDLLDAAEAAAFLHVRPRFMRRLVSERRIAFYKVGKFNRFDRHDLIQFAERGLVDPSELT